MRKKLQRGLALVLCIIMAFSCAAVPAGAVVISPVIAAAVPVLKEAVLGWLVGKVVDESLQLLKDWVNGGTDTDGLIAGVGALCTAQKTKVTEDMLRNLAYEWNATCSEAVGFTVDVVDHRLDTGEVYRIIAVRRGYVVTSSATQYCLADGIGRILYADATTELSGRWASADESTGRQMLDYDTFWNLKEEVGGSIREVDGGVFWEIYRYDGSVYCNPAGRRFSFNYANSNLAINANRPTTGGTVIEGDTTNNIDNSTHNYDQSVDIENMTQFLPGSTQNVIDNLIYDDNTKTYYVDSHNVTNNITQNFLYEYHINYTSITQIGATAEYTKEYKLYYQLPDGRDSADLTLEELEQLNVDIDVIPYVRSTDNVAVRSLYHFDGDTRDSSYFNLDTNFEWITGASLTYMESGAFNGALYLDENHHEFRMTLPRSTDLTGGWIMQWRYYQSATQAPVNDSSVYVGDKLVMLMDGKYFYTPSGDQIAVIPTGVWNEIAIVRAYGNLYYYVNGVYYCSVQDDLYRENDVRFVFGSEQQTFKYFDELRFIRTEMRYHRGYPIFPSENYTPSSVPHDSNLTLILPTGSDVVVDEISVLVPGEGNLLTAYGRDDWRLKECGPAYFEGNATPYYEWSEYIDTSTSARVPVHTSGYPIIFDSDYVSGTILAKRGRNINFRGTDFSCVSSKSDLYRQPRNAFSLPLYVMREADSSAYQSYLVGDWQKDTVYTYSVVLDDHSFSSVTFKIGSCTGSSYNSQHNHYCSSGSVHLEILNVVQNSEIQFSFENLGVVDQGWSYDDEDNYTPVYDYIYPATALCWNSVDGSAVVQYTELVTGEQPAFDIKYETAVYTSGELQHSPTLAVRTDIDITDHQIGGVRPSVPEKGQVWALVENGYITSLQVYTGSVWLNCDGRIWTAERWIPASSYNVITLQDMFDIVDSTQDYEYIYTESGFWGWLQKAWKDMLQRFDRMIELLEQGKDDPVECEHVYDRTIDRDSTCTEPGHYIYTCSGCGHTFTEFIEALGHEWPIDPDVFQIWSQPKSVTAPLGSNVTYTVKAIGKGLSYQWSYSSNGGETWWKSTASGSTTDVLTIPVTSNRNGYLYRCKVTDSSGTTIFSNPASLTVGELQEIPADNSLTCSRCGVVGEVRNGQIVAADTLEGDVFDALGDFIAEGIDWILDKATELVNALTGITDVFNRFVDRIGDLIGLYPAFLAAVFVLLPEDLTTVIWFGVIAFVMLAVWKKYNKS